MAKVRTTCPDCDGRLEPITLLDATDRVRGGQAPVLLAYGPDFGVQKGPLDSVEATGMISARRAASAGACSSTGSRARCGRPGTPAAGSRRAKPAVETASRSGPVR